MLGEWVNHYTTGLLDVLQRLEENKKMITGSLSVPWRGLVLITSSYFLFGLVSELEMYPGFLTQEDDKTWNGISFTKRPLQRV